MPKEGRLFHWLFISQPPFQLKRLALSALWRYIKVSALFFISTGQFSQKGIYLKIEIRLVISIPG